MNHLKVAIDVQSTLKGALLNALKLSLREEFWQHVDHHSEASIVILDCERKLHEINVINKRYILLVANPRTDLPDNSRVVSPISLADICQVIDSFAKELSNQDDTQLVIGSWYKPNTQDVSGEVRKILIVDDKAENLLSAVDQLGGEYQLMLADGYDAAMRLLVHYRFDIVLTDCQMPVGLSHSALALDAGVGHMAHNGILLLFFATKVGAKCVLVTDANHHKDWVSAAIDTLSQEDYVLNGQPVRFTNQKDWKYALSLLP